jgi:hypothetical protein
MLLLSFVNDLYTWILGENPAHDPAYEEGVFRTVLFTMIISTGIIAAVFYLLVNRWRAGFNKMKHWLLVLILLGIANGLIAMFYAKSKTAAPSLDAYMYFLGLVNMVYSMLLFFLFSWLLKRFSIFARYIPF